jgi:hypothetical protein
MHGMRPTTRVQAATAGWVRPAPARPRPVALSNDPPHGNQALTMYSATHHTDDVTQHCRWWSMPTALTMNYATTLMTPPH